MKERERERQRERENERKREGEIKVDDDFKYLALKRGYLKCIFCYFIKKLPVMHRIYSLYFLLFWSEEKE